MSVELPAITANGGLTLDAYELVMDDGLAGEYKNVTKATYGGVYSLQRVHVITNLTSGRVYRLKYRVLNARGWSPYSPVASMLVAGVPGKPA